MAPFRPQKRPSYLRLLSFSFFALVIILGASNHMVFVLRGNSGGIQPVISHSEDHIDQVATQDGRHLETRNHSAVKNIPSHSTMPAVSPPSNVIITKSDLIHGRVEEPAARSQIEEPWRALDSQLPLPLWQQQLHCPAGSAALCDTTPYELADYSWASSKECPVTARATTPDSAARVRAARVLLRSSPRAASPLAGYSMAITSAVASSSRQHQVGCGKVLVSYEDQIAAMKTKWIATGRKHPMGFTMTDKKYADLIEEHLFMASKIVGLDVFFVAVYDEPAKAQACRVGADVVTPVPLKSKDDGHQALRVRTMVSKFKVAHSLAVEEITFIFWEMDVFIIRRPSQILDLLKPTLNVENIDDDVVDLIVSSHQYSPLEPNIGIFAAHGTEKVALVFENTMRWNDLDANLHDQRAFCLVTRLCQNKDNKQSPVNVLLPASLKLNVRLLGSHDVSASVTPRVVGGESFAVHVLSTTPLQSPAAKSYLSREIRAHPPTPRWFATGGLNPLSSPVAQSACPGKTRLLAVEGMLSMSRKKGYHCVDCLRWSVSWLVAAAMVSGRTLVLPPVMFDFDFQYIGIYIDLASLSRLTPWRETSFLNDPRFQRQLVACHQGNASLNRRQGPVTYDDPYPFESTARIVMVPENKKYKLVSRVRNKSQSGVTSSSAACSSKEVPANNLEDEFLSAIAEATEAEVVFVSMASIFSKAGSLPEVNKEEGLVNDVFRSLRYCIKGLERGSAKGFIGETKLGNICQNGERRGGDLTTLDN